VAAGEPCTSALLHRIIEWFGFEETLKIIWFQPPCHEQRHLPPDQVAQSSIQPGLEHCQGGGSHSFSGRGGREERQTFPLCLFSLAGRNDFIGDLVLVWFLVKLKPLRSNIASSEQTAELNCFYQTHAKFSPPDPWRPWSACLAKPGAVNGVSRESSP